MKDICKYKPLFSKKRRVKLEGSNKSYDSVYVKSREFVVFENKIDDSTKEYYLYSLETGKLLLVSKNYNIELFDLNDYLFCITINKNKYLFKINSNEIEENVSECYIEIESIETIKLLKNIQTFTFIIEYLHFFYGTNLFFTPNNEIFYINENLELEEIDCPFKNNTDYSFNYIYYINNSNSYAVAFTRIGGASSAIYYNLYDAYLKKFLLKKFIDIKISDFQSYNGKIYITDTNRGIFDEEGNYLVSDSLADNISFHPSLPYVFTKRNDRKGLISLEEEKVIFKPVYIEILVDEEEIMFLDSEGGAYKSVSRYDR